MHLRRGVGQNKLLASRRLAPLTKQLDRQFPARSGIGVATKAGLSPVPELKALPVISPRSLIS
jgi:hypothetical protein